jgi:hypothetical protein
MYITQFPAWNIRSSQKYLPMTLFGEASPVFHRLTHVLQELNCQKLTGNLVCKMFVTDIDVRSQVIVTQSLPDGQAYSTRSNTLHKTVDIF